jgi:hypothetical protein
VILDSTAIEFRRSRLLSIGLSSGALLSIRATNAWAVGASVDDVSTMSSMGGVVQTVGPTANALPPRMDMTY